MGKPYFDANGVNVSAVRSALAQLAMHPMVPSSIGHVATNAVECSTSSARYEQCLTYLLGAMDMANAMDKPVTAAAIRDCRQQIKAAVPGRSSISYPTLSERIAHHDESRTRA